MQLDVLRADLADAEGRVAESARHVSAQRAVVAELERTGGNSAQARRLLDVLERIQDKHIADRNRLAAELAAARDGN
jgi:hypothetical protein